MAGVRAELAVILSFAMTIAVIVNAFYQKKQFYPSVVFLTKSNSSMAILYFQAFVFALIFGKLMNKVFFGQLRAIELEHLFERSWYAITETCLAFTVFRDDFSPKFVTMFTLLLFLKCFHWLAEDRIDYMERSPVITFLFHIRMLSLMTLLIILDLNFVYVAYTHTIEKGASVQLVFGFEYAILFIMVLATFIRYILHTIDIQNENPWENKGIYMLYADLVLGFVRVVLYLTFMTLMIKIHTFPLFAIRPIYLSLRAFKKSLNDVIMSRRAIRNLNIMYPDVTPEQLRSYSDTICIICREEMSSPEGDVNSQQIKKLPCDHIFHKSCLRSWFQRQQTCPTCRTSILRINDAPQPQRPQAQPQQQQQPPQAQEQQDEVRPQITPQQNAPFMPPSPSPTIPPQTPFTHTSEFFTFNFSNAQRTSAINSQMPLPSSFGFLPPFAFMPPPLPPLNLSPDLTDDELAEMEQNERHNVEARIHCLRNINILLNASMIQMQQYMNICASTSHLDNISKRTPTVKVDDDLKFVKNEPKLNNNNNNNKIDTEENKSTIIKKDIESETVLNNVFEKLKQEIEDQDVVTPKGSNDETYNNNQNKNERGNSNSEDLNEIRQRRLNYLKS